MNQVFKIPHVLKRVVNGCSEYEIDGMAMKEVEDEDVLGHMAVRYSVLMGVLEGENSYCVVYIPEEKADFASDRDIQVAFVEKKIFRDELLSRLLEIQAEQTEILCLLGRM